MDIAKIKASTDEIVAQFPQIEGFIEGIRQKLTDSVQQVVGEAMKGVADGIGVIAQIGYSIDGATLTLTPSGPLSVKVEIPTFTAKVSMPLVKP